MPTPRIERETTITYNEEGDDALLWSASPLFHRKMTRLGIAHFKAGKRDGLPVDELRFYRLPKTMVKILLPRKVKELTVEQRAALAEQARVRFSRPRSPKQSNPPDESGENTPPA